MLPAIEYSLSFSAPSSGEREALSSLTPSPDARWHEKLDAAKLVVTALHEGTRVGVGIVHTSVTAPTLVDSPVELGAMFVHPAYRRLGIREQIADTRLTYALSMGGTPITVIDNRNDSSWRHFARSGQWAVEQEYTGYFTGLPMTIWVATESAWHRTRSGLSSLVPAQPGIVLPDAPFGSHNLASAGESDSSSIPA